MTYRISGRFVVVASLFVGCNLDELPNDGQPPADQSAAEGGEKGSAGGGQREASTSGGAPESGRAGSGPGGKTSDDHTGGSGPGGKTRPSSSGGQAGSTATAGSLGDATVRAQGGSPGSAGSDQSGGREQTGGSGEPHPSGGAPQAGAAGADAGAGGASGSTGYEPVGTGETQQAGGAAGAAQGGAAGLQPGPGGSAGAAAGRPAGGTEQAGAAGDEGQLNQPPIIESFSQSASIVLPGGTITLNVAASDPEGRPLAFEWNATGGVISEVNSTVTGSNATWTAPATSGSQQVTVAVYDPEDLSAEHLFTVASKSCAKPVNNPGGPSMRLLPEGFCIDTTEVTREQYQAFLATKPDPGAQDAVCSWNGSFEPDETCLSRPQACKVDCASHPQICIDWCDASAYCQAVGKRLCGQIDGDSAAYGDYQDATQDQWYAACTSGGQYYYVYGGSGAPAYDGDAALCNGSFADDITVPAGSELACVSPDPSYAGVYDLSGNVWEWTDSCDGVGADASCHIRGGSFINCFDPNLHNCDYPYNQDACYYGASLARDQLSVNTGFRCCSE